MSSDDADRQIQQMIAFIKREAEERSDEILVNTKMEAEKLTLQMKANLQIKEEYEKKKQDFVIQKKIAQAKLESASRVRQMRERDNLVNSVKAEVLAKLAGVSKHAKYPELIKLLIVEGLIRTMEPKTTLNARKEDLAVVKKVLPDAIALFKKMIKESTDVTPEIAVEIDEANPLPAGPSKGFKGVTCAGGVLLTARRGKIKCSNTLDSRLNIVFDDLKPQVRSLLFGERPAPVTKAAPEPVHH